MIVIRISCQRVSQKGVVVSVELKQDPAFYVCMSVCDPLCCKNMCCASRFWTGGREAGGSGSKNLPEGPKSKC